LFIAGDEAGGNIAAATSLMVRDRDEPPLAGQILFSPMLDVRLATASLREVHAGSGGCPWAAGWHQYLARPSDALHPYAAPGAALRLAGLPPTLLVTAYDDPMRDEATAYSRRLLSQGVRVDKVVLAPVTGFPASYLEAPPRYDRPWLTPLRKQIRRFLKSSADARKSQS